MTGSALSACRIGHASVARFFYRRLDLFCRCCTREDGNGFRRGVVHRHHDEPRRAGQTQRLRKLIIFLQLAAVVCRQFSRHPDRFGRSGNVLIRQLPFIVASPVHVVVINSIGGSPLLFPDVDAAKCCVL